VDIAPWLAEQIEAHSPEREEDASAATRLAEAYAALAGSANATQAFGVVIPADIADRDALRTRALELLKAWLAKVDGETKEKLRAQMSGYGFNVGGSNPPTQPPPMGD
jgi:hypothetical protein